MICSKCGKEINSNANFCQYCGQKNPGEFMQDTPIYNTLSIWKLVTLFVVSFGFYEIIWAYNLWKQGQKKYERKISPFWRSIFIPITNFELFPLINDYITKNQEQDSYMNKNACIIKPFPATFWATIYLLSHIADRILSKISSPTSDFSIIDLLNFLPAIIALFLIVTIQHKINRFNFIYNMPVKHDKWTWKTTGFVILCLSVFLVYVLILALSSNS